MIIAYIGNFDPEFSTENDVRSAFESLGHVVVKLQENRVNMWDVRNAALSADMLLITSTWDNALPLGEMITLFKEMAALGKPTATLHLDTFWSTGRQGRQWWLNPMFHTAYIFTADGDYQEQWKAFGKNHIWLPPAVRHTAAHFGKRREEYVCDVAFVGSNGIGYHEDVWSERKTLVDNLREMCARNGWTFKNPGGDNEKVDRGEDLNDFYASATVTVGDSLCLTKEKSHYWSDRVPEATGRGGFLIMPNIHILNKEDENFYYGNLATYPWNDYKKLEETIKYYLENRDWRIGSQSETQRLTAENHTYVNRAETILKEVGLV